MKPAAYKLLHTHHQLQPGTTVYSLLMADYGLANDDTRATGIEHVSVTLKPDGSYPSFTVPKGFLQPIAAVPAKPEQTTEPGADGWIPWNGGVRPVGKMTKVRVRLRAANATKDFSYLDGLDWAHTGGGGDVIAYQVQPAEPTNQPSMLAEAVGRWRTEATTQRYARRLSESRLEIATDLLREADEYREQPLPDALRARIDRFLHAADTSKCGHQGENCRLTADPHDGAPVCMTCDARGEVRLEGGA